MTIFILLYRLTAGLWVLGTFQTQVSHDILFFRSVIAHFRALPWPLTAIICNSQPTQGSGWQTQVLNACLHGSQPMMHWRGRVNSPAPCPSVETTPRYAIQHSEVPGMIESQLPMAIMCLSTNPSHISFFLLSASLSTPPPPIGASGDSLPNKLPLLLLLLGNAARDW